MCKIEYLSIDLETKSGTDLGKSGVYRYTEDPEFAILLFGYSVNGGEVSVVDMACGEQIPEEVLRAVVDESVVKWAFNAAFERICLSAWLRKHRCDLFSSYSIPEDSVGNYLNPVSWRCSMVWAAYLGLPLSLEGVGAVLKLQDQKMAEGKTLIKYFSVPCKPTVANGGRRWNLPEHAPDKWNLFKSYNKRDVEVEMGIQKKLSRFPVPESVWDEYHLSEEINDRGIALDREMVRQAIALDDLSRDELSAEMQRLTQMENPNSVAQMKQWLADHGIEVESLDKKAVRELLKTAPPELAKALELRQQLARSSVKKYIAMENCVCADGRCRGMFQFYGANRSGRWAGRLVQLQNLPQNHIPDLAAARSLVKAGDYEMLSLLYEDVPDTLSQLVRTAFVPKPGYKFIVSDFSAIEARVIAYLAGEQWRLDLFARGGDIYCQSASQMFKAPVEKHGVNGHLRQKGKIAELACIAEGQLVLTNHGEKPIEEVLLDDLLWDGTAWVQHEGVVYKGIREVITYEGLTATPDHFIWIEGESEPVQFGFAAASGAHLLQTGNGGQAIRLGEHYQPGETLEPDMGSLLCADSLHGMQRCSVAVHGSADPRKVSRLSGMFTAPADTEMAGSEADSGKATVRESERSGVSALRRQRNTVSVPQRPGSGTLSDQEIRVAGQSVGTGSDRYEQSLCPREHPLCHQGAESSKSEKYSTERIRTGVLAVRPQRCCPETFTGADQRRDHSGRGDGSAREKKELEAHQCAARLYDIRNAGPHHRFTVSGKLVHNCGYGGSVGALKAMGALEMGLQEEELQPLVNAWRESNPNIVAFWWDVDDAVKKAIRDRTETETHGLRFQYQSGILFIQLPSGRRLSYVKPKIGVNKFGGESVSYEGVGTAKKWERIESYGPKFVENIVQAISRDILCYAMQTLSHCFICGHVHDELIIEASKGVDLKAVCEQMGRVPPWLPGAVLRADGYECQFYMKQ